MPAAAIISPDDQLAAVAGMVEVRASRPVRYTNYTGSLGEFIDTGGDPWQHSGGDWRQLKVVRHVLPIIEDWALDKIDRLAILAPPQTLKTTLAVCACAYRMRRCPDKWVGYATYRADKASQRSAESRRLYSHGGGLFRVDRADYWTTDAGGGMWSAGIGGGAGERTHALVLDDLDKNEVVAKQPAHQRNVDTWRSYIIEGRQSKIVVEGEEAELLKQLFIQSRMPFESDSAGRIFQHAAELGESWTIVPLSGLYDPAVLDYYRALSDSFTVLDDFRDEPGVPLTGTEAFWSGLIAANVREATGGIQQHPRGVSAGGMFSGWWLQRLAEDPGNGVRGCRAWDLGHTESGGDWTTSSKQSRTAEGRLVLRHGCRGRKASRGVKRMITAAALLDGQEVAVVLPQDPAAGKSVLGEYIAYVRKIHALLGVPCPSIVGVPAVIIRQGKEANFQAFCDQAQPISAGAEGNPDDIMYGAVDLVEAVWEPVLRDVVPQIAEAIDFGTITHPPERPGGDPRIVMLSAEDRADLTEIERAAREIVVESGRAWWSVAGAECERFPNQEPDDCVDSISHGCWYMSRPTAW